MRKVFIGFVSLGVVLGVYLLYARISETPEIDTDRAAEAIKSTTDGNAVDPDSQMGKIGDVGVGPAEKAHYVTRNPKTQEIVREFGFEKLLHQVRGVWEIEKPYMNIYRRNFKCFITADKGEVQVETAVGRTTPKDATFSSNVVIHTVPTGSGSIKESFVHLDNIIFLSEKSLLMTTGPIRFESEDARMRGTGLELIYNEQAERLEYFKIADLESMSYRVTNSQAALFPITQTPAEATVESNAPTEAPQPPSTSTGPEPVEPNETIMADASGENETLPTKAEPSIKPQEGEYYKCVLNDNVLIDTPEQLIFAEKKLLIHDIFWSKAFIDQTGEVDADGTDTTEKRNPVVEQAPQNTASITEPNVPVSEPAEPNEAPDAKPSFMVITCDGGLIIVPKDSTRIQDASPEADVEATASDNERPEQLDDGMERTKFFARTIDYHAVTGDVITDGLSELTYYKANTTSAEANEPLSPMKITAHEGAKYSKTSNQVVFSDCLCTMPQAGLTEQRDVTFSAPEITFDLPEEKSKQPDIHAAGPVELAFYMEEKRQVTEDPNQTSELRPLTPVTVNARTRAHYSASLNQMAFEGDCRCTMLREDPNMIEEYVLLSERMTVDLAEDANDRTSGPAAGLEHLTATGEIVHLATTRTASAGGAFADGVEDANGTRLLGGIELKCQQFDYDAVQQLYWATGPGIIKLNNAIPADPNEPSGSFSLRDPCWAIINGFDTLRYSLLANRIVADSGPYEKLGIVYLPTADGEDSGEVTATASYVEALLRETTQGRTELATLNATGGVLYEDDRGHQFIGSELFYDHTTAIVKVKGDEVQPCYYNGILVDQIQYDVNADKVECNVVGPGTIQLGQ